MACESHGSIVRFSPRPWFQPLTGHSLRKSSAALPPGARFLRPRTPGDYPSHEVAKLGRCDIIEGGAGVETGDESMRPAEDGPKAGPEAQQMGTTPTTNALPLPVLMDNGTFQVVSIPKMTRSAFDFFKRQLEAYAAAIILPDGKDATEAPADAGD